MTVAIRTRRYNNNRSRRRVVALQRCAVFSVLTIFMVIFGVLVGSNFSAAASSNAEDNSYKYYTSIQVEDGDSLWSIAAEYASVDYPDYNAYIEEVAELNCLSDETIHAGQYLTIPYYSGEYK